MIVNPLNTACLYKCSKRIMEYLVYDRKLPIYGLDGDLYYFAETDELKKALKEMPMGLKIFYLFFN
jgi:hypothetical protein